MASGSPIRPSSTLSFLPPFVTKAVTSLFSPPDNTVEMAPAHHRSAYPAQPEQAEQEPLLDGAEPRVAPDIAPVEATGHLPQEHRLGDFVLSLISYTGLLLFLVSAWYLVFAAGPLNLGWFAFHPLCQSLGIALNVLGILTLQPTTTPTSKALGLARHQTLQLTSFALLTLGISAIIFNKAVHNAAHFTTWHSIFGLVSYAWLWIQSAVGAASVWWGGKALGGGAKAKKVWKYHRISGYLFLVWMLVTVFLAGEFSDWTRLVSGPVFRAFGFGVSLVLVLLGVLGRTRLWKMRFW